MPVLRPAFVQLKRADPDPYYDDDDAEIVGRGFGSRKRYGSGYDGGYYGYGGYDDGYDGYGYGYGPLVPLGYVQGYGGYHHGYNQGYQGNHGGNNRRGGGTNGTNGTVVGNNNVNNVVVTTSTFNYSFDLISIKIFYHFENFRCEQYCSHCSCRNYYYYSSTIIE